MIHKVRFVKIQPSVKSVLAYGIDTDGQVWVLTYEMKWVLIESPEIEVPQ